MTHEIVKTLVELGLVKNDELQAQLNAMSVPQLIREYVFPRVLCLPRAGLRYPRIDGSFMTLMTKCGREFLAADHYLGSVLLEMAMQRITKHPDLPAIDYRGNLPEEFKPYAASSVNPNGYNGCPDEPGLWGSAEVHFIVEMLPTCLDKLAGVYQEHAKLILFQLLTNLNRNDGRFMWLESRHCDLREVEVWVAAFDMLFDTNLVQEFVDYCLENGGWRQGISVFSSPRFYGQDLEYLLTKIDLDQETYFTGTGRTFLKVFGLYNQKTREKILEELQGENAK